ncbi:hypothetical protein BDV95DRAFT_475748, partial [Massariosphaeria phaeospora]
KADSDPYTHYRLQTGPRFHGKTVKQLAIGKQSRPLQLMLNDHYHDLDKDHIIRRAL